MARDLGSTLQSVLVGAASVVFARAGRAPISVTTPVDLRRNLGIADDVALRIVPMRTIWTPAQPMTADSGLRDAVTATDAQLAAVRNPQVLASVAGAISSAAPADPEAAEYGMAAVSSRELMLTNLGVIEFPPADPAAVSVIGMKGLAQTTHIDENVLGVVTFGGELHMTNVSEEPMPELLDPMTAERSGSLECLFVAQSFDAVLLHRGIAPSSAPVRRAMGWRRKCRRGRPRF